MPRMSMDRFRRVSQLWNWLPAFRGVAEQGGIHRASSVLGISGSALSRTVKLLEDAAGAELFVRRSTSMELTEHGTKLLAATRTAMRLVDDALPASADSDPKVTIWIGTSSPVAASLATLAFADASVKAVARPRLAPIDNRPDALVEALVRGDLDLVVSPSLDRVADVVVDRVGDVELGVYASPSHPSARGRDGGGPTPLDLTTVPFVVREGNDGWPLEKHRQTVATCTTLEALLVHLAGGEAVTYLPDAMARRILPSALVRLCDGGPRQTLYAAKRTPLAPQRLPIDAVVEAIRRVVAIA